MRIHLLPIHKRISCVYTRDLLCLHNTLVHALGLYCLLDCLLPVAYWLVPGYCLLPIPSGSTTLRLSRKHNPQTFWDSESQHLRIPQSQNLKTLGFGI